MKRIMHVLLSVSLGLVFFNTVRAYAGLTDPEKGFFLSPGVTAGVNLSRKGWMAGGECSWFYFYNVGYAGVVFDGVYDTEARMGRFMIGPEVGFFFLGMDGGMLIDTGAKKNRIGFALRPYLSIPLAVRPAVYISNQQMLLIPYYRFNKPAGREAVSEFGLMIKFPTEQ